MSEQHSDRMTHLPKVEIDNRRTSLPATMLHDPNGNEGLGGRGMNNRGQLVHSVSIIVEPVIDEDLDAVQDGKDCENSSSTLASEEGDNSSRITTSDTTLRLQRKERIHSSPIIVMDDHFLGKELAYLC